METKKHQLLYISKRSKLLWMVMGLAIGLFVLTGWLVSLLTTEQLMKDFDSILSGRLFQAGLLGIGTVFIWPMIWLSNKYVVQILKGDDLLTIKTWSLIGIRTHALRGNGINRSLTYHEDRPDFAMAHAPYLSFKANEKKFIIDMQGDFPEGEDALTDALNVEG
jgi:hypothetical protein